MVRLAEETANWLRTAGRNLAPDGPRLGQCTQFGSKNRSKLNKKAAVTLPEWILCLNGEFRRPSQRCRAPFSVILGSFGSGLGPGPNWPTDTILGQKSVKTRQRGSPHSTQVDSAREHGRRAPRAPVSEPPGPVFGDFGPFWARFGPTLGPPQARPFGRAEAHRGRETGIPGPKDDCSWSQDPFGGLPNPDGELWFSFSFGSGGVSLLLACCLLLDAPAPPIVLITR